MLRVLADKTADKNSKARFAQAAKSLILNWSHPPGSNRRPADYEFSVRLSVISTYVHVTTTYSGFSRLLVHGIHPFPCGLLPGLLPDFLFFAHRAAAAFFAIAERCSGVSFAIRASTPFLDPLRPILRMYSRTSFFIAKMLTQPEQFYKAVVDMLTRRVHNRGVGFARK